MTAQGMLAEVARTRGASRFRDLLDNDGALSTSTPSPIPPTRSRCSPYTGGTTGAPKGAMLTHANLTAACSLYQRGERPREPTDSSEGEERCLCVLPLFHIYCADGRHAARLPAWARNSSCIRASTRRRRRATSRLKRITVYLGVPTMHTAVLEPARTSGTMDFSSLRLCASGGAPLPVAGDRSAGTRSSAARSSRAGA